MKIMVYISFEQHYEMWKLRIFTLAFFFFVKNSVKTTCSLTYNNESYCKLISRNNFQVCVCSNILCHSWLGKNSAVKIVTYKWLGVRVLAPRSRVTWLAFLSKFSTNSSRALEIITGTGAATLPTSSSVCIIFLIRAWKEQWKKDFL